MRRLRVAVVQLECHPAIYVSHLKYLEEPFQSAGGLSLSRLSAKGLNLEPAQKLCLERYSRWQDTRLRAVIRFLEQYDPVPDVVILPEGAVPVESLEVLASWSASTGATILAGTLWRRRI